MLQSFSPTICTECKEVIYNPLCPSCLAKEMQQWLDGNAISKKIQKEIKNYIIRTEGYSDSMKCIICKDNYTDICPYCFTEHVYEFLQKIKANKQIINEFFDFFNFDFEHSGYSKDFEEEEK